MDDHIEAQIKTHQQELIEPAATLFAVQRGDGSRPLTTSERIQPQQAH